MSTKDAFSLDSLLHTTENILRRNSKGHQAEDTFRLLNFEQYISKL